ncbi:hypothetical protein HR17_01520 [Porphyromonas gulae]|uniref:Uncharacterized protein n=1 Tax=Porphyromonas gulae TaxID=111105 RepID=A0A099WR56_9PORP|nr:hypothetical protein HQ49_10540 [Porphyromonas gulae]KGL55263.1 hypothetical protein HQ50_05360 [Porphyromonas sp. COT-052 OH4946]KGN70683.1 hypothetical protein HR09_02465 [Porphyromonas gulae]KGN75372.1 hypothetical protein HQ40_06910 [Porphyromonas gulae]KGN76624.1 hypothetical protein HR17_01520 [Porphyromonas gulae]
MGMPTKLPNEKSANRGAQIPEKSRQKNFDPTRKIFTSRTKVKKFTNHVFRNVGKENFGVQKG